jgi:aconitate hydratase
MAPEYGATCGFFGIDDKTLDYMRLTGREEDQIALVEAYAKEQGFWIDPAVEPIFSSTLELDLSTVVPSLAGPKRPQDRVSLPDVDDVFNADMANVYKKAQTRVAVEGKDFTIGDGDVTIAAITSCTNTSNPGSGRRRSGRQEGRRAGPEAQALGQDLAGPRLAGRHRLSGKAGLQSHLDNIGFNLVGYGCTTCIGNSGPLAEPISKAINENGLPPPSSRATATSRAASRPTCAPTSWPAAAGRRLRPEGHGD